MGSILIHSAAAGALIGGGDVDGGLDHIELDAAVHSG